MSATQPRIRLRGLAKSFGDKVVLDGVDLDVLPGTSMVVIGGIRVRQVGTAEMHPWPA